MANTKIKCPVPNHILICACKLETQLHIDTMESTIMWVLYTMSTVTEWTDMCTFLIVNSGTYTELIKICDISHWWILSMVLILVLVPKAYFSEKAYLKERKKKARFLVVTLGKRASQACMWMCVKAFVWFGIGTVCSPELSGSKLLLLTRDGLHCCFIALMAAHGLDIIPPSGFSQTACL